MVAGAYRIGHSGRGLVFLFKLNLFRFRQAVYYRLVNFSRASAILSVRLSVCPSVCLSVRDVPVSDENGLTYCHSFFSPYGSPIILVLSAPNIFTKFRRGPPCGGAKYRWGIKVSDILPISRYISQTIQDSAIVTMKGE